VNLWSKSLIFFLNMIVSLGILWPDVTLGAKAPVKVMQPGVRKKNTSKRSSSLFTQGTLPIRLMWQVIRSQGQASNLNTSAETFALEGLIIQTAPSTWELRTSRGSIFGTLILQKLGQDGRFLLERKELLKLLGVELPSGEGSQDFEHDSGVSDAIQIPLMVSPTRQLDTVYRGPEDDLFLVKLGALVQSRN